MFECPTCGKVCKSGQGLGSHRQKTHNYIAPCGTTGAYLRHKRNGEKLDVICIAEWNKRQRRNHKRGNQ